MASGQLAEWYLNWLHGVAGWRIDLTTRLEAERIRSKSRRRLDAEWTAWRAKVDSPKVSSTGRSAAARLSAPSTTPSSVGRRSDEPVTDTDTYTDTDTARLLAASGDGGDGSVDRRSLASTFFGEV